MFAVIAFLATTAQLAVALAPLAEGREGRATVHIESRGTPRHTQHSETNCAACQARSIHGTTARAAAPAAKTQQHQTIATATVTRVDSADVRSPANPRAPPSVI
jgi:hypothetical protein